MFRVSILTVLIALLVPAVPVVANASENYPCFTNSTEAAIALGCYNIGDGAQTATIKVTGGKYIVSCNGGYTCIFYFAPDRPGPGHPEEP